jgi:uncharacterized membrane protein
MQDMETAGHLRDLIKRQKEILSAIEAECQAYENSDLAKENSELKKALEKLRADFEESRSGAAALADENAGLKNALYEQIYNEKIKIINTTAQKLDIYFQSNMNGELNRLSVIERDVKRRIKRIREALAQNGAGIRDEINARLDELSALLDRKITEARSNAAGEIFLQEERDNFEALKNEQLTEEQVRAAVKKNNLEKFVGLNILNAIGIFLLIIGVITVARYTSWLPDMLKGILMFTLGGAMLAAGEFLNRKKPNVFSLGVSAGGVGILYTALAASYFGLLILDMYPAVVICVLITTGAFILSNRYNSQIIAAFALIGGYLPIFSMNSSAAMLYGAMVYFIALNLFALIISFGKKWRVSSFIGLFLNIIGTVYICLIFNETDRNIDKTLTILYVVFAFSVYAAIPIISAYRLKIKFKKSDVVLLAINTFFSGLIMYGVFYRFDLQDCNGLLAVCFAAVYLFLGKFVQRKPAGDETAVSALFYLTGLAFVVLAIPLQFGRVWLSLGWLAEGVLLAAYGILREEKRFKQAGFIISLLCLGAFAIFDCAWPGHYLFAYKYLAITLGSLIILGAYMYKKMTAGRFAQVYKYFVLVNAWFYTLYIIGKLGDVLFGIYYDQTDYQIDYLTAAASVTATFLIAYAILRIKILFDPGTKILSVILYVIGILGLFYLNTINMPVAQIYLSANTPAPGITFTGTAILAVLGILSVFAARDLMKLIVSEWKLGVEWYPLIISGYFVVIFTQNLITQFGLSFSSAAISIIYVLTALVWIIFGFTRRYSFIRRFGLALAILAVVKLFLVDLSSLTQGYRIISYFALGITLIAISFVYQYFSRRLELKELGTVKQ